MYPSYLTPQAIQSFVASALAEDVGEGDHSALGAVPANTIARARLLVKDDGIIAGVDLAGMIFKQVDSALKVEFNVKDGGGIQKGDTAEKAIENSIETMRTACAYAAEHGVFLGLENHGGIVAEPGPVLQIVKEVNSPWLGINLDSGNFQTEDPYADFAKCAPYAVNVQIKTEVHPKGKGTQRADLKRFIGILRDAKYQGYIALEFEENADPWQRVPAVLDELHELIHHA
jgi:hypothetical protein